MKRLKEEFESKGFKFKQLDRNDFCAIYAKTFIVSENELGSEHYEVIDVMSHNGREIHGTWFDPAEFFPSDSVWGTRGWSYTDKAKAFEKYHERTKQRIELSENQ